MSKQSMRPSEAPSGVLSVTVRQGNAQSTAPWADDENALQLTGREGIFDLRVVASVAEKVPDEPDDEGHLPEFGTWRGTKRQISLYLLPQDRNALAWALLYCWKSCLDPKVSTINDALVELSRVAADQGWTTLTDVIKASHRINKGGRKKGTLDKKTTVPYMNCFKRLKAEHPEWSDERLLDGVASAIRRHGKSKATHRINIKKALQREKLIPKKVPKTRKLT